MIEMLAFLWVEAIAFLFLWVGHNMANDDTVEPYAALIAVLFGLLTGVAGVAL